METIDGQIRTVTGEMTPIQAKGLIELSIGNLKTPHEIWVADIYDECILGMDFLQKYECLVDLKKKILQIGNEEVPLVKGRRPSTPTCCRVVSETAVTLPPQSEVVIPAKVQESNPKFSWGIIQSDSSARLNQPVLVCRALVDVEHPTVPVRVMNLSSEPQNIRKGTHLASCEPIISVLRNNGPHLSCDTGEQLPEHVQKLYERSSIDLNAEQKQDLCALLKEFADIFSQSSGDLGQTDIITHSIHTGDATPVRQPPRRLPLIQREAAQKAIQDMQQQGIIEPSKSPWASPIVLVKKKDGSYRFCVDYRKLNEVTKKDSYPLPRIEDSLETLAGMQWFSALDLRSGYWQVQLDEDAREKTAFTTGTGLWQYTVMPFGLCNAPATFERLMEQVLLGLPQSTALVYLDDVLVPGRNFQDHLTNLREVFQRLREAHLKLSPDKCELLQKEVKYLGHIVSVEGIATDPQKNVTIKEWPTPRNVSEVKSFLGLCSYYRRFVPSFSDVAQPLNQLCEKGQTFLWTTATESAFQQLKVALTEAPVMAYPIPGIPFILDTDASNCAIGAVLSQVQQGEERVIAYFSKSLSKPEKQYCVTRKELLAIVQAIKHFHHYLYGRSFTIRTDHSALRWLFNFREPEGQIARWIQKLQEYTFSIQHHVGHKHSNADSLSRRPCLEEMCRHCERLESKQESLESHCNPQFSLDTASMQQLSSRQVANESLDGIHTKQEWQHAQKADADIEPIIKWMKESPERPQWEVVAPYSPITKMYWAQWKSLRIRNDILFRLWESHSGDQYLWQLVLPKSLHQEVFKLLHNPPTSGHFGVSKTVKRIQQRFYWPQCSQDIKKWCANCDLCASRKGPAKKPRAKMQQYNVGAPMERIALDILGPLPQSATGNKYIVIIADYFTKWPEAFAVPDQEATTVANLLVREFVCRYGVPLEVHSDQGRNFESAVFAEMCTLLGMEKTRTTPYHPQSDGMVERLNRTLEAQLSIFVDDHQTDWDTYLPMLMMAYRTAVQETTRCSPAKLMFGRELKLPIDLLYGRPAEERRGSVTPYAENLLKTLEDTHDFARRRLELASDRMKSYYDSKCSQRQIRIGDAVWLHNPQRKKGISPKLSRPWQGPYIVTKCINDLIFRIQLGPKTKPKVVHHNRLWKYQGEHPPTWFLTFHQCQNPCKATQTIPIEKSKLNTAPETESQNPNEKHPRRSNRSRKPPERFNPADY